jgi:hypothetical protein
MSGSSSQRSSSKTKSVGWATVPRIALVGLIVLFAGAIREFYDVARGTGTWYAEFSPKWFAALVFFIAACLAISAICVVAPSRNYLVRSFVSARGRLHRVRALIVLTLVSLPVLVLQYTPWGVVFFGPNIRVLLWTICLFGTAWIISPDPTSAFTATSFLAAAVICGTAIVIGAAVTQVTGYPFSLGWSEGNRLWDYSLLFGKSLYVFEPGKPPSAYLDIGRQIIGGLPFLLPHVTIEGVRAWLAIVAFLPYLLAGILAFYWTRGMQSNRLLLVSLFGILFLSQGPIHAPLVICAILVLAAWRLPIMWGAALLAAAGFFAESSRFTWMFAPTMWAVMLEVGGATPEQGRVPLAAWRRAIVFGTFGLLGSGLAYSGLLSLASTSVASSASVSTSQPLLWYRLLPNATFGDGIILGVLKATGPLIAVACFIWLRHANRSRLQALVVGSALLAFLVVGLVVSTKIGGGGDLHNLDMFLLGLLATAAILWKAAGPEWLAKLEAMPIWIHGALALCVLIPAYGPLLSLRPLSFAADADWVGVLTDVDRPRDLGSLPDATTTEESLSQVREAAAEASTHGPVLFMDQRQLLTFGYVRGVDLVSEYEKKRLMDEALSGNTAYFVPFYRDLARKRFALIVSSPLRTPIRDSDYGFGEENNAWVNWVARPVLCYYEEFDTLNEVKVELLVPREGNPGCDAMVPDRTP